MAMQAWARRREARPARIAFANGNVASPGALRYGGGGILQGTLTFGALVAFLQYAQKLFRPIRDMAAYQHFLQGIGYLVDAPENVQISTANVEKSPKSEASFCSERYMASNS